MKVLLAEDTRDLNRAVSVLLTREGYEVDSAYDGIEAYDFALKNGYDVIVLDIMMPGMDGITVLKKIRAEGNPHPAPPSREDSSHMISAIPARCARLRRCIRSAHPSFPHPTTRAVSATTA